MAKDDYQVIAYKVLVRLYVCLKARFGGLFSCPATASYHSPDERKGMR